MEMVNCKINGIAVSVPKGSTILEAARAAGVEIPTLCYMKKINEIGACRICIVEATGARGLVTACVYPVSEGMVSRPTPRRFRRQDAPRLSFCSRPTTRSASPAPVRRTASFRSSAASTVLRKAVLRVTSRITSLTQAHLTSSATTTSAFSAAAVWLSAASSTSRS